MINRLRAELSAIYIVATALFISLSILGVRSVAANSSEAASEKYPELYTADSPEMCMPAQKTVYFTFDDGPSYNTEKILDMLAAENIKATFFVSAQVSDGVDAPALLRRMVDEGHEIGLHTYTHDYNKVYCSLDSYLADLNAINDYVIKATGYRTNILRFPGGSGTTNASPALKKKIVAEIQRRGYRYYDWDVESGDQSSKVRSAEYLADKIVTGTKDRQRIIVLLHDSPKPKTSCEAVRLAIPRLREKGYCFDKLTAAVDCEEHYS